MPKPSLLSTAALLTASLTLVGCGGTTWFAGGNKRPAPAVQPSDFIGEPRPAETVDPADDTTIASQDEPGTTEAANNAEPTTATRTDQALPIDAMVGHINGEAVYAEQVFDVNLIAQLESFGRRYNPEEFRQFSAGVIQDRLQGIIINKLILGEAERNLKENQRRGIEGRIQAEREELLRFYGQGSLAKAKAEFIKERGKDLEAHLVDFREELIIGSYIRSKVLPKIVVNQRDVERYYDDNIEKYQQPDARVIRLIIAADDAAVAELKQQLENGVAFEKLAGNAELNRYNPDNAGLYQGGIAIPGKTVINQEPVNDALLPLAAGEYAGPIVSGKNTFFVEIIELTEGVKISLADAQIKIEQILRSTQFEDQALRFRLNLLKRGSYSDPAQMGKKLLDIAAARYDK